MTGARVEGVQQNAIQGKFEHREAEPMAPFETGRDHAEPALDRSPCGPSGLTRRDFATGVSGAAVLAARAGMVGTLVSLRPGRAHAAQALPSTLEFPKHLSPQIDDIKKLTGKELNPPFIYKKKYHILEAAFTNWKKLQPTAANSVAGLSNPGDYILDDNHKPAYFGSKFNEYRIQPTQHFSLFYDYEPRGTNMTFWLDFANLQLGGGVFSSGFVQEEVMCCETPDLANAAALPTPIQTRHPANDAVRKGSPTPIVIMGVNRVLSIDTKDIYGSKFASADLAAVKKATQPLPKAQTYNVLAAAAPKLPGTEAQYQFGRNTLEDLFNTFVAAFQLALAHGGTGGLTINTGKIGAGAFHNDAGVVYVLQRLAAEQVSERITLKFWGYSDSEASAASGQLVSVVTAFNDKGQSDKTVNGLLGVAWTHWGKH